MGTIAEQLKQIAENQQKVFEAGAASQKQIVSVDIDDLLEQQNIDLFLELTQKCVEGKISIVVTSTLATEQSTLTVVNVYRNNETNEAFWRVFSPEENLTAAYIVYNGENLEVVEEPATTKVSDVQDAQGNSFVENGVAKIPIANGVNLGLVRERTAGYQYSGIKITNGGEVGLALPTDNSATWTNPQNYNFAVTSQNLYRWMEVGLTQNDRTLSEDKKTSACKWLGATKLYKYYLDNVGEEQNQTLVLISPNDNLSIRRVYFSSGDMFLCINTIGPYGTQIFPTIISAALYPFEGAVESYHTASNMLPLFTDGRIMDWDTMECHDEFCGISGFHFYMNYPSEDITLSVGNGAFVTMALNDMLPYYAQGNTGWYSEDGTDIVDVKPLYRMEV